MRQRVERVIEPEALTVPETAKFLSVSRDTVYRLARTGEIPHTRVGAMLRFRRELLIEYLKANTTTTWLPGERTNRGPKQLAKLAAAHPAPRP